MKKTNKPLPRGIDSLYDGDINKLISDIESQQPIALKNLKIKKIDLNNIVTNPFQPRKIFNLKKLEELEQSIVENGLLSPIIVTWSAKSKKYILIAGERRFRACKNLRTEQINTIVLDSIKEEQLINISLVENNQRENLSPIEEAEGFKKAINFLKITQEELANKIGKPRTYVTNALRLLKLPKESQKLLQEGKINVGHGKILSSMDHEKALSFTQEIITKKMSVKELSKIKNSCKNTLLDHKSYCNKLTKVVCSKVEIDDNKISILYHGEENLKNILEILGVDHDGN